VVDDAIADALPLPVAALTTQDSSRDVLLDVAQQAEELATALNRLAGDLRRALGADPIPWDKSQRPGDIAVHGFDRPIRRLFAGLRDVTANDERIEQGRLAWELTALSITRAIAESVLGCTPPAVFTGREKDKRHHTEAAAEEAFLKQLKTILTRVPADQLRRGI
jgi:CRISPR system Cascade subunit CasA